MPLIRSTSTINIKPSSVSAGNIRPSSTSTTRYAAYIDPTNTRRFGTFKFGQKKFGTTTEYSIGQVMPKLDTVQL